MAENVIELNGKRYDAVSGAYLGVSKTKPDNNHPVTKGRAIDGFIRPTATTAHKVTAKKPVMPHVPAAAKAVTAKHVTESTKKSPHHSHPTAAKQSPHTHAHQPAAHAHAHQPQHSHTLMRRAVHKPEFTLKPAIKPQAPAEVAAAPASAIMPKRSALQVDSSRLERAKNIAKHDGVRRFMPVRPDHSPAAIATTPHRTPNEVPVIAVRDAPPLTRPRSRQHTDIFETALARADSHKQPRHPLRHPKHRRVVNAVAGIAAFLVIGGFITYLNLPNIQLHIASVQAGFKAELPGYKPTGYALQGGVKRAGNTVTLTFRSGENSYTITQQPSDWNSQTLAENTLALSGDKHKTLEAAGRTIYVYDGSNAVWVNGGVRYDLNTNAPLSSDDITRLASSL